MRRGDRGMRPRRSDARVRTPNRRQPATGNGERARDVSAGEKVKRNREVDGREERALGRERGRTSASNAASALSTSPVIFENSVMTTTSVSQDPRCGQIWAVELTPVNRHFAKSCQKLQKGRYPRFISQRARAQSERSVARRGTHSFELVYPRLLVYRGAR